MMTPATYGILSGLSYGRRFKDEIDEYARTAAWWAHGESLPDERNTVTLDPSMVDSNDLPVARVTYRWAENDVALAGAARDKASQMMDASGAVRVRHGLNYGAHAMGGCRMGSDPADSVVDPYGRTHDVKNLFICDTSVFVTGSGVNPTLTAMAIADRTAGYIVNRLGRDS
jgi:choline dehydrogenase-like flavoprotein